MSNIRCFQEVVRCCTHQSSSDTLPGCSGLNCKGNKIRVSFQPGRVSFVFRGTWENNRLQIFCLARNTSRADSRRHTNLLLALSSHSTQRKAPHQTLISHIHSQVSDTLHNYGILSCISKLNKLLKQRVFFAIITVQ